MLVSWAMHSSRDLMTSTCSFANLPAGLKPTDEEIAAMIKDADKSGSGKIGFNEFYSMMTSKMAEIDRPSDLRTAFECYDTAGKGFISAEQFRAIMAENHGYKFTDKEVRLILRFCITRVCPNGGVRLGSRHP